VTEGSKVAVVTGGTRGIGLAIGKRLVRDGYDLVLSYRGDEEAAANAKTELDQLGRTIVVIAADVSTADGAGSLIESAVKKLGHIDVLINNAGITPTTC
jgi:3-oxoacyl-[acyl-carrier protein] reductase